MLKIALGAALLGSASASPLPTGMQTMGRGHFEQALRATRDELQAQALADPSAPACEAKGSCNAGVYIDELVCRLNDKVNASTFESFKWEIQGLWEYFCAINRGIFVLQPGNPGWENHTYSCGTLPKDWNIDNIGNLVLADVPVALHALDQYIQAVFNSSDPIGPDTCDFHGLATLTCNNTGPGVAAIDRTEPWKTAPWAHLLRGGVAPLRSANVGGLFVLEPWITPDITKWDDTVMDQYSFSQTAGAKDILEKHWTTWYTAADFQDMTTYGLNSIRLPVGWWYFAEAAGLDAAPYIVPDQKITDMDHPIVKILQYAMTNQIMVTVDLHGAPGSQNGLDNSGKRSTDPQVENWGDTWLYNETALSDTTKVLVAMTNWINDLNKQGITNVIMLELVNEPWVFGDMSKVRDWYVDTIKEIRSANATLPLLIHDAFRHEEWAWLLHHWQWKNIFMDTHLYHAFNINDLASSNPECDKSKMVAHENLACRYGSLLRYKSCVSLPTYTGEWSLTIDNCIPLLQGSTSHANQFVNWGQCNNLAARDNDPWWDNHTKSFAMRQIAMFERELGWAFWTYKLHTDEQMQDRRNKVWCFKCAVQEGWIDTKYPTNMCEHQLPNYPGC